MSDYYKDTPPLTFISDVYDIMRDGDNLPPDKLVTDVVGMLKNYLSAQQSVERTAKPCVGCGSTLTEYHKAGCTLN